MTIARRLADLEATLTPTELACRWLDEAHGFDDLTAYVRWLFDQPDEAMPAMRLLREARDSAQARLGRPKPSQTDEAVREALRATLFRFELVLPINVVTHEEIEREALLRTIFAFRCATLAGEDPSATTAAGLADTLELLQARVRFLAAMELTRTGVEAKYLDGHPALFPAERRRWDTARLATAELAALPAKLGELDGWAEASDIDEPPSEGEVARRVEDLVEPAKVIALEKLDEGRRAFGIATRWLRSDAR